MADHSVTRPWEAHAPSPHEVAVAAGLVLSDAQAATLKAITGAPLAKPELRAFRKLTGTLLAKPRAGGYLVTVVGAGRRSGKTLHVAAPFAVSALLADWSGVLAPGERGRVLLIGPTLAHVRQLLDGIAGILSLLRVKHVRRELEIEIVGRRTLAIATVADHLGPRGGTAVAAVVDEGALLPSEAGADGFDEEVLAAVRPALATTRGRLLITSSPWRRAGVHFDMIEQHLGKVHGDVLALTGPTWTWNPTLTEEETRRLEPDERRWSREWNAIAGATEAAAFDPRDIRRCITAGVVERPPRGDAIYGAAIDLAFAGDGCVLAIGHLELLKMPGGPPITRLVVDHLSILRARKGERLDSERVIDLFAGTLRRYRVRKAYADQHGFDLARSAFEKRGIKLELLSMNLAAQAPRFDALGGRLRAGTIALLDNDVATRELGELQVELLSTGLVRYQAPRRRAASDDVCDALAALCKEATDKLPPSGGDIVGELRIVRDGPAVSFRTNWFEVVRDEQGREVRRIPTLPPPGTPVHEQMTEELRALGTIVPGMPEWNATPEPETTWCMIRRKHVPLAEAIAPMRDAREEQASDDMARRIAEARARIDAERQRAEAAARVAPTTDDENQDGSRVNVRVHHD